MIFQNPLRPGFNVPSDNSLIEPCMGIKKINIFVWVTNYFKFICMGKKKVKSVNPLKSEFLYS